MKSVQKPHEVGARRAKSCAGRNICDRDDLQSARDVEVTQCLTSQSVLDLIDMVHQLGIRIADTNLVVENRSVHTHKHIFVDRDRKNQPSMLTIKGGEVCS